MSPTASGSDQELFLQPVADAGPDPFTESTANAAESRPPVTPTQQPAPTATQQGIRSISGATAGLYGGTHNVASCDVDAQIRFLTANQRKSKAFAEAAGISEEAVPGFLRGLTPVQLRGDTRVTHHGFRDGAPTAYQSVLQTGTAVLIDNRGMPRVRCACGNPLPPGCPTPTLTDEPDPDENTPPGPDENQVPEDGRDVPGDATEKSVPDEPRDEAAPDRMS